MGWGKAERPGWCCLLSLAHPPGRLARTHPPPVDLWALACISTYNIARLANGVAGDAHFPDPTSGCPNLNSTSPFTLTRLPVPSIPVPGNRSPRDQLGWPRTTQLPTTAPCPSCLEPDRLAAATRLLEPPQHISVADGSPSTRSDPAPSQLPALDADSSLPRLPEARLEVAGEYVLPRTRCAS